MRRTRWTAVLACFVTTTVISLILFDLVLRHRGWVPGLTAWGAVVAVVMTVLVLVAGLAVRRLREHRETWMTPIGAAVTAAAAQASALVGVLVGGVYAGELVVAVLAPSSPAMCSLVWAAGGCLLACLTWSAVGLLVEYWCAIDMSDDDEDGGGRSSEVPGSGAPA